MKKKKIKGKILLLGSIYGVIPQDENLYKNSNIKNKFDLFVDKRRFNKFN